MPLLLPLNPGDYIEVRKGFAAGKEGEIEEVCEDGRYKISYDEQWCGWHARNNLKIIKRASPINGRKNNKSKKSS